MPILREFYDYIEKNYGIYTEKTKKSSMKTAPNGRIPARSIHGNVCKYHGWSGTWRGI